MQIYYYNAQPCNAGDLFNLELWPRLFGADVTLAPCEDVLVGIGSVLDHRFSTCRRKLVVGAGARSITSVPAIDQSWKVLFVRGPLTAHAMRLPMNLAISDPGLLVPSLLGIRREQQSDAVGLVPYYLADMNLWKRVCSRLGLLLISPSLPPVAFVESISRCKIVLAEAMHGAIIADALGIPWIPIQAFNSNAEAATHEFKWMDFCLSVNLDFAPLRLPFLVHGGAVKGRIGREYWVELAVRRIKRRMQSEEVSLSADETKKALISGMLAEISAFKLQSADYFSELRSS